LSIDELKNDSDIEMDSELSDDNVNNKINNINNNRNRRSKSGKKYGNKRISTKVLSTNPKIKKKINTKNDKNDFKKIDIKQNHNQTNKVVASGLSLLIKKTLNQPQSIHPTRHKAVGRVIDGDYIDSSDEDILGYTDSNDTNYSRKFNGNGHYSHGSSFTDKGITIKVYFENYLETMSPLNIETSMEWTVLTTINASIKLFNKKYNKNNWILKSNNPSEYQLRCMDIDDDDIEIDMGIPAFDLNLKINNLGINTAGIVFNKNIKNVESKDNLDDGISGSRLRSKTFNQLNNDINNNNDNTSGFDVNKHKNNSNKIYIKIQIPGPTNESHIMSIDNDSTALTLRDLFGLLNKKKKSPQFSAKYFDFYYKGLTKDGALGKQMKVLDLPNKELVILPKIVSQNEDLTEAYEYPLVKLANEPKEFNAVKIKSNQKRARLLAIDRYRIVKKVTNETSILGFGKKDHIPIDIKSITNIRVNLNNTKQFILDYRHPKSGVKTQIYEMSNSKNVRLICDKIKYLCILRKLQG